MYFYHLAYQLRRTDHAFALACEEAFRPLHITLSQVTALLFVDRFPEHTMASLAGLAAVAPPTMHRSITALQNKGWLQREHKTGDGKSFYLSLTPTGTKLLQDAEAKLKAVQDQAKAHLEPSELETLNALLQKYEAVFQKNTKETIWSTQPKINRQ